ncbi:LuxR C-terminal-related transcriptional regulator [Variovorax sp. M-6]|uniref:helix-turn-helix transcriptional regulator n=1 Tax=Variovorax sp. M-6 TaxID=3233041 RepID=UPI003F9764C6
MKKHELGEWGALLLGLYRASHETALEEFQDAALACVRPLVSFDASMWGTATLTDQGIDIHTLHLHRKSPEMMAEYEPLKDLDDAAISLIGLPRATRSFDSDLLGGPDERRPYYSEAGFDEMLRREWSDWNGGAIPREVLEHFLLGNGHYLGRTLVLSHRTQQGLLFLHARPRRPVDELSPREHVIAELMAMGKTYKEIAKALERSPATVRNQIRSIYQKLGVTNIAGLIEGLRP